MRGGVFPLICEHCGSRGRVEDFGLTCSSLSASVVRVYLAEVLQGNSRVFKDFSRVLVTLRVC